MMKTPHYRLVYLRFAMDRCNSNIILYIHTWCAISQDLELIIVCFHFQQIYKINLKLPLTTFQSQSIQNLKGILMQDFPQK